MKETPLHDLHARSGASLVEFGGWHMPVQYGPILDEVRRVREKAAYTLGLMGKAEPSKHVLPLVRDEELEVRAAAVFALGRMKTKDGAELLRKVVSEETLDDN